MKGVPTRQVYVSVSTEDVATLRQLIVNRLGVTPLAKEMKISPDTIRDAVAGGIFMPKTVERIHASIELAVQRTQTNAELNEASLRRFADGFVKAVGGGS